MRRMHVAHFKVFLLGLLLACGAGSSMALQSAVDESTWQQVRALRGIPSQPGMTHPSVFVFFDPNCPYCAKLWGSQLGNARFSALPAVWIPVTYLGDTALGKGAFLLRSNSTEQLDRNFTAFHHEARQGGAPGVTPTEAEKHALGTSKAIWLKLGGATPLIVYRTREGEARKLLGLPTDARKLAEVSAQFAPSRLSTYPPR